MAETKEKVLGLLLSNSDDYISGEELSNELNLSRNAIWKAINSLKEDGHKIDAIRNKGYKLSLSGDILSAEGITSYLMDKSFYDISVYDVLPSTNTFSKEIASKTPIEGKVIVANNQTQGRGRYDRRFFSPDNSGVYFSITLRPTFATENITFLPPLAALAVCKAVEKLSNSEPRIKWVNDVYIGERKICGILSEASFSMENNKLDYVILGIGINIYRPKDDFPEDIKDIAGCIFDKSETDIRNKLIAEVLNFLYDSYKNFDAQEIAREYKNYSFLIGREVYVMENGKNDRTAKVLDINEKNELVVQYNDDTIKALNSGEVSIKINKEIKK